MPMREEVPQTLTQQLRYIVGDCGKTLGELARQTGVDKSALSRFLRGERGLSMEGLDKVGTCLGLAIVQVKKSGMGKARKPKGR
jgi:transcriptional regulator with XRE-family HTH domain